MQLTTFLHDSASTVSVYASMWACADLLILLQLSFTAVGIRKLHYRHLLELDLSNPFSALAVLSQMASPCSARSLTVCF